MSSGGQAPVGEDVIRTTFVEMLFALAVGEVALRAADVWKVWTNSTTASWTEHLPAASHLLLALLLIGASWVGWRKSNSPGMKEHVETVFSPRFLDLLLDVLLVIFYFILVRQVELAERNGTLALTSPSAAPEASVVMVIFAIYALWDFKADVIGRSCWPPAGGPGFWHRVHRILRFLPLMAVAMFASLACLGLSSITYRVSQSFVGRVGSTAVLDLSLGAVVLSFRAMKAAENPLANWLRVRDCRAFQQPRVVTGRERAWTFGLLAIWGAAILVTCLGFV